MRSTEPLVNTAPILQLLRRETAEAHAALENQLSLFRTGLTQSRYHHLLIRLWGYYVPLEGYLLTGTSLDDASFSYFDRVKTPWLERDLLALGETPETLTRLPCCEVLPKLDTVSAMLGCLYVIEDATLGGQIIQRHVQANLGLTAETGCAFFAGYGSETAAQWHAFGSFLSNALARSSLGDGVVAGARETFAALGGWLGEGNGAANRQDAATYADSKPRNGEPSGAS